MEIDQATELLRDSLQVMLVVSSPILAAALVIGLLVSILQAVTQVQEQTLSFVPKIVGMAVVAMLAAPWAVVQILDFSRRMFGGQ